MTGLRRSCQSEIAADGALQLGQPLLVGGEVHRLVHLVHAQLARAVEHHREIGSARRIARLAALHRLAGDGDELVVKVDLVRLGQDVRIALGHLCQDAVA